MASSRTDDKSSFRRSKRVGKESSEGISIEELFPDDMAYDADVEAVQPDLYEDAESDTESTATPKRKFHTIDEELAARMKQLGHDCSGTSTPQTPTTARGRKRRGLHEEAVQTRKGPHSDLEVVEIIDKSNPSPPPKRTKRARPRSAGYRSDDLQSHGLQGQSRRNSMSQADSYDAMDTT